MSAVPRSIPLEPNPSSSSGAADGASGAATLRRRVACVERHASCQALLLSMLAELLGEPTLERALDAFAATLQRRFGAERVAVALAAPDGELRFATISQQALADVGSAEVELLIAAMREACALERTVCFPEAEERLGVLAAHRTLAGRRASTTLASLPLYRDGELVGAVLLERRDGAFHAATITLLERIALVAAPLVDLRREADRGPLERWRLGARASLERRLGAERPGVRLSLAVAAVASALALLVPVEHPVRAEAELVPRERRLVTAPVDGFVDEVSVSAGERVERGQVLARLDRRELELELARHDSESTSAAAELRTAMASHDRQATAIARARLEREHALRSLVEQRLARAELRAPISGLIISGDPSDAVGMPVRRGDTLFEIAPAGGYEVHLLVDERDVHDVHEGQGGTLALRAHAGEALDLVVQAVHPVAESGDGRSRFRVRATLGAGVGAVLRPGQSGTARLEAGTTSLVGRLLGPLRRRVEELRWRLSG